METKCPKCSNYTDQVPIGMNLTNDTDVYECEKCQTLYAIVTFENREEADQYTESYNGEVL